jgi:hypothetical protein
MIKLESGKDHIHDYMYHIQMYLETWCVVIAAYSSRNLPKRFELLSNIHGIKITVPIDIQDGAIMRAIEKRPSPDIQIVIGDNDPITAMQEHQRAIDSGNIQETAQFPGIVFFISGTFSIFWDRYLDKVKTLYGADSQQWPSLFNFARVIRNACSHGGKVNITNPSAKPVTWHAYTISPADHGRHIIDSELSFADIVLLMLEISDELRKAAIPL